MISDFQNILCAIDFSSFAKPVIDLGIVLARRLQAKMIVFHAIDVARDGLHATDAPAHGQIEKQRAAQATTAMQQLVGDTEMDWEPMIGRGQPVDQICRLADAGSIDLVIAASYGLSGVQRVLLGTVVEALARKLCVPMLVVRRSSSERPAFGLPNAPIVVGCLADGQTEPALRFAVTLAKSLKKRLHVVHALESPLDASMVAPDDGPYSQVQEALQAKWLQRIDRSVHRQVSGVQDIHIEVAAGLPDEALIAHSKTVGADLLVVGRKPGGLMKRWVIGSTTENVLRHAACTVMVVP